MRRLLPRLTPLALAALLGACGGGPEPIVLSPPAEPGPPPAGVDGRYRGTARLVRAQTGTCPRSGPRTLEISGGAITLSYSTPPRNRQPLTAEIRSNGRIEASDGVGSMEGEARDGRLEVTIASQMCEHRWTMTKME